jgi:hypothetical protein
MLKRAVVMVVLSSFAACGHDRSAGAVAPLDAVDRVGAGGSGAGAARVVASEAGGPGCAGLPRGLEGDAPSDGEIARWVTRVDEVTVELAAALVPRVLADPVGSLRGARIVPSLRDGRPSGFKLYAIRPGSLVAALGLRNGDLVVTVDREAAFDAGRGLALFARIRGLAPGDTIAIGVERVGRPLTITYRIR